MAQVLKNSHLSFSDDLLIFKSLYTFKNCRCKIKDNFYKKGLNLTINHRYSNKFKQTFINPEKKNNITVNIQKINEEEKTLSVINW